MELVPSWLKLLRLHKYTELIMSLTYEEMMTLTEDKLETQGVTKGARRKIVTNIHKLRDRPRILSEIILHLDREDCNVKKVLMELEILLQSPIKIGIEGSGSCKGRHDSGRYRHRTLVPEYIFFLSRDSGAEVSEDDCEEGGGCEGVRSGDIFRDAVEV